MNKLFLYAALGFILCLAACTCNNKKPAEAPGETIVPVEKKNSPLEEYVVFMRNLDTFHIEYSAIAAEKFSNTFKDADSTAADSAYILFAAFHDRLLDHLLNAHYKDGSNTSAFAFSGDSIVAKTPKAKRYAAMLRANGFTLGMAEGETYVKQDFDFIARHFYKAISTTMRTYLQQVRKENKEGFLSDAAMVITPTALAQRIIFWDEFITQHPSFVFNETIQAKQLEYRTFLLEGIDNTPLFNHSTKQLSANYADAYGFVLEKHPTSKLAEIVRPYFNALQTNSEAQAQKLLMQYRSDGKILDF